MSSGAKEQTASPNTKRYAMLNIDKNKKDENEEGEEGSKTNSTHGEMKKCCKSENSWIVTL